MFGVGSEFDSYSAFVQQFQAYQTSKKFKYVVTASRLLKSTAKQQFAAGDIVRLRYAYKRYRCMNCSACLSLKHVVNGSNGILRIIAFQVDHEHAATDEREQIYVNLGRIRRIVGRMPVEYVPVIDRMVEKVVEMLLYCQQNDYAALENLMDVKTGEI